MKLALPAILLLSAFQSAQAFCCFSVSPPGSCSLEKRDLWVRAGHTSFDPRGCCCMAPSEADCDTHCVRQSLLEEYVLHTLKTNSVCSKGAGYPGKGLTGHEGDGDLEFSAESTSLRRYEMTIWGPYGVVTVSVCNVNEVKQSAASPWHLARYCCQYEVNIPEHCLGASICEH